MRKSTFITIYQLSCFVGHPVLLKGSKIVHFKDFLNYFAKNERVKIIDFWFCFSFLSLWINIETFNRENMKRIQLEKCFNVLMKGQSKRTKTIMLTLTAITQIDI